MSSMQGMRKASVLPLPVLAAARTSLQRSTHTKTNSPNNSSRQFSHLRTCPCKAVTSTDDTYLPSSRGRILLCWISVMCSKPISFTPFSVCSLTSSAREAKDVSSNAPETSNRELAMGEINQSTNPSVPAVSPVRRVCGSPS